MMDDNHSKPLLSFIQSIRARGG